MATAKSIDENEKTILKTNEENEKTILKSIEENEKTIIKTFRAMETTDEAIERMNEENTRIINDLFGYDVNQARIQETICTEILPRYVIDVLGVSESYILEFHQKRLYNPTRVHSGRMGWNSTCRLPR